MFRERKKKPDSESFSKSKNFNAKKWQSKTQKNFFVGNHFSAHSMMFQAKKKKNQILKIF